ncbi:MAG: cytochrome c biogenesis protein CcsA [Bacteroidia bacterium]
MGENQFLGEHLFIGNLGHTFVVISFVAAILSGLFYLRPALSEHSKALARGFFALHTLSVLGIFITLFVIIQSHYFEYAYAYQHSSTSLPLRYMVSCFWEGQEGSFLLWIVWNSLIGLVLMGTAKKWENGVMAIMALSQVILVSMILGVELGEIYKIGSSPFELLRDKMGDSAPIFSQPNYLKFITDGTGLNPLLQNYWMVIHPPTLFLGFALCVVPFAFAVTALFKKEHRAWIKPTLPWALVAGLVLGAGIIMGGFWAYESLSFGGYWAWDPVENASLVPWLLLISGIHLMLIKKVTNTSTIAAYILVIASYILVLYATFLTRSGVLGETSVHSFTDLGLAGQLMQLVVIFVWLPVIAVTRNKTQRWVVSLVMLTLIALLPFYSKLSFYPILILSVGGIFWFGLNLNRELENKPSEDNVWSREFWMFIGALVLLASSLQIIFSTSLPVINKIFGSNVATPADVIGHYNRFQLPFAIVIGLLTAVGQYFSYRNTPNKAKFFKDILVIFIVSILLTIGGKFLFELSNLLLLVFLFSALFAFSANLWYSISYLKAKVRITGGSITHLGFALMMVGVLVSSSKKRVITADFAGSMQNFNEEARKENMMLIKDQPERLGDFMVTYLGDSTAGEDIYFRVNYKSLDGKEEFDLYPNTQISSNEGLMPNPDTRHYLTYDVYTHITALPKAPDSTDWKPAQTYKVEPGDSISTSNGVVVFRGVEQGQDDGTLKNATIVRALVDIYRGNQRIEANPVYVLMEDTYFSIRQEVLEAGLSFNFEIKPNEDGPAAYLEIAESSPQPNYIVMKGIVFPYINLLWLGTIIMVIGFGIAAVNRLR